MQFSITYFLLLVLFIFVILRSSEMFRLHFVLVYKLVIFMCPKEKVGVDNTMEHELYASDISCAGIHA